MVIVDSVVIVLAVLAVPGAGRCYGVPPRSDRRRQNEKAPGSSPGALHSEGDVNAGGRRRNVAEESGGYIPGISASSKMSMAYLPALSERNGWPSVSALASFMSAASITV